MALNIRNKETEELAAKLARLTGETKTEAVRKALEARLARLDREKNGKTLADIINEIGIECSRLPIYDNRTPDEILGYDEYGLPT